MEWSAGDSGRSSQAAIASSPMPSTSSRMVTEPSRRAKKRSRPNNRDVGQWVGVRSDSQYTKAYVMPASITTTAPVSGWMAKMLAR
ncbi:MAG: hypothetical protein H6736_06735 [Alphaproteobacteria bacterium]|nr:hypothetical protein [Alphaproteobacteria bacterium]